MLLSRRPGRYIGWIQGSWIEDNGLSVNYFFQEMLDALGCRWRHTAYFMVDGFDMMRRRRDPVEGIKRARKMNCVMWRRLLVVESVSRLVGLLAYRLCLDRSNFAPNVVVEQ